MMNLTQAMEKALYNKVIQIKDDIYNGRELKNDLPTKVVLAISLMELCSYEHKPSPISFNLQDSKLHFKEQDLESCDWDYIKDIGHFQIYLPKTKDCMDLLKAIYLKKSLDSSWEESMDYAYKSNNDGLCIFPLWNLIFDMHEKGWINFPPIEKYTTHLICGVE